MTRTSLLVGVMVTAVGLLAFGSITGADPGPPTPAQEDGFAGKILVVSSKSNMEYGAILEKVQVKSLGGKPFLVGTSVRSGKPYNWAGRRTVWFPVDDAAQIVEFANLEELDNARAQFKP